MLNKKGGWEVQELPRLNWFTATPFRWTQLALDKTADSAERVANTLSMRIPSIAQGAAEEGSSEGRPDGLWRSYVPSSSPCYSLCWMTQARLRSLSYWSPAWRPLCRPCGTLRSRWRALWR